jgi:lipopolysaccharide transport system ATP-binding protein
MSSKAKDLAVSVRGLSKSYVIAHNKSRPTNLREAIVERFRHPFGNDRQDHELFWAIKNIDFDIRAGEVVGIIGRNGAGKSTLLKILSRITWPTAGEIDIHGRVSSLLEVGTGFHPELTGRENVYLNGSVLGMSRSEVKKKFDEIVDFAGVEKFLDTPVKRYSSGMYVRLAFAVAANLDPEILIVDEVLAVGDAQFQQKCLGKMQDVSRHSGRTILFVSHNMNAVLQLCERAILLNQGQVEIDGLPAEVMKNYMAEPETGCTVDVRNHPNRDPSYSPVFQSISLCDSAGNPTAIFGPGETVQLKLSLKLNRRIVNPMVGSAINNWRGERLFGVATYLSQSQIRYVEGDCLVVARFELPNLVPGTYTLGCGFMEYEDRFVDLIPDVASFSITPSDYLGVTHPFTPGLGSLMVRSEWEVFDQHAIVSGIGNRKSDLGYE